MQELTLSRQQTLVQHLAQCLPQPVQLVETHISWVLLSGERAYKIKKALDLGFLDYSTLVRRHEFCCEELRLNRRTAPELYLAVLPVGGGPEAPRLGAEPAIEYAVEMRRFEQEQLLDGRLNRGEIDPDDIDRLGLALARFHAEVAVAGSELPYGRPARVHQPIEDNFRALRQLLADPTQRGWVERHAAWAEETFERLQAALAARKEQGYVRECHGDLHLGNLAMLDGRIAPFDGIEFNPDLRWIDVMNELAFLAMDLEARGAAAYARRVVNGYLEQTGDYPGLALLDLYRHYRAMVRAKVTAIRLSQPSVAATERLRLIEDLGAYFTLAEGYARPSQPGLLLTFGPSGSGKSGVAQYVVETLPRAVRLRSDVERKRLFGLAPQAGSRSGPGAGIYTAGASARTYQRLLELAQTVITAGYTAVVDATFLEPERRAPFAALAERLGIPFSILALSAPVELLRRRVSARQGDASEATLAILEAQLERGVELSAQERALGIPVDTAVSLDGNALLAQLRQHGFAVP